MFAEHSRRTMLVNPFFYVKEWVHIIMGNFLKSKASSDARTSGLSNAEKKPIDGETNTPLND
jgi:hypothetical protein